MSCVYLAVVTPGAVGLGVVGACVEFSPSQELSLPPCVSPPLPPKFGACVGTGKVETHSWAASSGSRRRFQDDSAQLTPGAQPPPAGADPTLRCSGPAPAASAHNFAFLSAEPAPSGPGSAPSLGAATGRVEGGRCGRAQRVRTPGGKRRQAGAVLCS